MEMKDFARYLKYESFDKALHHIRQISFKSISDVLEYRTPEEIINEFNNSVKT
jgi:hypothetical protein